MCNLYSMTKAQDAIRQLFAVTKDSTGNLPSMPGIFPDRMAPIVRNADAGRELALLRWGMPSSSQAIFKKATTRAEKLAAKGVLGGVPASRLWPDNRDMADLVIIASTEVNTDEDRAACAKALKEVL